MVDKHKSKLVDEGRKSKGIAGTEYVHDRGKNSSETEEAGQNMPPTPPC